MIIGLGMDLVGVERIRGTLARHGARFLDRVCSADEQAYCLAARDPAERLAARWAAKEAAMKALGTGWADGVRFTDFEVLPAHGGPPALRVTGRAADIARARGAVDWFLTMTHSDGMAAAVVVIEGCLTHGCREPH